ncbi:glycoside hydrolase family 2 protein [Tengunoibacter tsumagoiensis]|uniref:Hydrolase n=1 Tax=Tengunoibacter tsumagoiensis TaxID=2014871 RepID=A0A402A5A9_9CHLR|nr:sugar-binding domain-containing protein [Tengunoibacter tsumagoiensis]GCE14292.1 hydrolase [Tengunoibacter tsumagoiensis]
MNIPRPEYPRPQFVRPDWLCLNGEWEFEIDHGNSGFERGLVERSLQQRITVPFCPESELSGIHYQDFMQAVWYRRTVTVPSEWAGQRVLLHFQAADYDSTVWVNGAEVARHRGGFTPFSCDLGQIAGQTITIVVRARDDSRPGQPRGKQSQQFADYTCFYTRTTGIWQTVWLEPVPEIALRRTRITPDVANGIIRLEQPLTNNTPGLRLHATLLDEKGVVVENETRADLDLAPRLDLTIPAERRRLWQPEDPHLYDLIIELRNAEGKVVDRFTSYAGLRSVSLDGKAIKINGKTIFQRLVLDQGYYPDGIMTAPNEEALIQDIKLGLAAGFNGARLHQKVFEERFLYHADKMGYLVWGEFPDWGALDRVPWQDDPSYTITFAAQWLEELERDYSHPAIVGWCALNETIQDIRDSNTVLGDATRALFLAAKAMDTTRPVLDASGYSHRVLETDVYDSHYYLTGEDFWKDLETFKEEHSHLGEGIAFTNKRDGKVQISTPYRGQPYFVSEFGGMWWQPDHKAGHSNTNSSWGYGIAPDSEEEFYRRFQALCDILLDNEHMFGYCYTQLTDVSIEQNGIYTYARGLKFDGERLRKIQTRQAAIEKA